MCAYARSNGKKCSKPNCTTNHRSVQRHHRGHEAFLLAILRWKYKDTSAYTNLRTRYWRFHKQDITFVCEPHHVEAHKLYDQVISRYRRIYGSPITWSWAVAMKLRKELRSVCDAWLQLETPGSRTDFNRRPYRKQRKQRKKK